MCTHTDKDTQTGDTQLYKHTPMDTTNRQANAQTHIQEEKAVSVNVCTSTTLSNMWARGRKDSITSSGVV